MEPLVFVGSARGDLSRFPNIARRRAGFQLFRVQQGREPVDWKPMQDIGPGVREIRVRDEHGAFRVIYIASLGASVYVLHAFEKKTQRTARRDIDIARHRLRIVVEGLADGQ